MFDQRPARILVIDDNLINRKKLRLAVVNLGYDCDTVEDGSSGILALQNEAFDAVLLDILMPGMDGFEVLHILKNDAELRELPVIVISDLEGDSRSASAAIELGAEDFLPKTFDPVMLNARLKASLRKKQFRDQELEHIRRINALTNAAARVEAGRFDAEGLDLAEMARADDPIGKLALVFQGMATEIYAREVRMLRRIQTLQCSILLLICGGAAGMFPSLSRMSAGLGANPIGLAFWVDVVAALLCFCIVMFRGGFPRLSRKDVGFFVAWAFLVGVLQHMSIFILAGHVEATFLALVLALEALLVFTFAAVMRTEKATPIRLLGLLIGLVGVGISIQQRMEGNAVEANLWLIAALIAPVLYAVETIAVAHKRPEHVDPISAVGILFAFSTVLAGLLSVATGTFIAPSALVSPLGWIILWLGCLTVVANVTAFMVLQIGGSVFSSQSAYVTAIAGVFWGILLLGERMTPLAWASIGLVFAGMYLVGSKVSDKPIMIKRRFVA